MNTEKNENVSIPDNDDNEYQSPVMESTGDVDMDSPDYTPEQDVENSIAEGYY